MGCRRHRKKTPEIKREKKKKNVKERKDVGV